MRVNHCWIFCGKVTLWYEGDDIQSDYFPAMHRVSQKMALRVLQDDGYTPGCYISACNSRRAGQPESPDHKSARRFAAKAGIAYRDAVAFNWYTTWEDAHAAQALEPDIPTEIRCADGVWALDLETLKERHGVGWKPVPVNNAALRLVV